MKFSRKRRTCCLACSGPCRAILRPLRPRSLYRSSCVSNERFRFHWISGPFVAGEPSDTLRNTLHLGCCLWRHSGCARCVFLFLSLVLDERFEASALHLQIWRILWLETNSMTSLCSTCTGVSANSVVSAVAGCLVFFRLQWVLFPVEKSFVRFAWAESPT